MFAKDSSEFGNFTLNRCAVVGDGFHLLTNRSVEADQFGPAINSGNSPVHRKEESFAGGIKSFGQRDL